jgi:hypothetical protein
MMEARDAELLEPIAGLVTISSRKQAVFLLGASTLLFVFGLVLLGLGWIWDVPLPLKLHFLGGAFALFCGLCIPVFLCQLLIGPRLVLGKDRVQVVQRESRVVAQVPYANVAGVSLVKVGQMRLLRIDLRDPDDPDTWLGGPRQQSFDLTPILYTRRPKHLEEMLQAHVEVFRSGGRGQP